MKKHTYYIAIIFLTNLNLQHYSIQYTVQLLLLQLKCGEHTEVDPTLQHYMYTSSSSTLLL
jgi:hypothetical protein